VQRFRSFAALRGEFSNIFGIRFRWDPHLHFLPTFSDPNVPLAPGTLCNRFVCHGFPS
jgi:hypothetical protein